MKYLSLLGVILFFIFSGGSSTGYEWQWYRVPVYFIEKGPDGPTCGRLLSGLFVTIEITTAGMILAVFFGLSTALMRVSTSPAAALLARVYLEFTRNTPLLIQLFLMYFVISPIFDISAFVSAVLCLGLFEGAYMSEIIRAGILSVRKGQWEAAYSLGVSPYHTYRHVILPQALRQSLPSLAGQAISLVKDSALVSTIAIYDLTMQGQSIVAETFLAFEIWFCVAAIYLVITLGLSGVVGMMERRREITGL